MQGQGGIDKGIDKGIDIDIDVDIATDSDVAVSINFGGMLLKGVIGFLAPGRALGLI